MSPTVFRWLSNYRDGSQNGRPHPVRSVWTRGNGGGHPGLRQCQAAGLIISEPDATLNPRGWRHDITEAGLSALQQGEGEGE